MANETAGEDKRGSQLEPKPHKLTAIERRVVWTHRLAWLLWEGQFGVHRAYSTDKWLRLTGSPGRMAQCLGLSWSINSLCNMFLNPIIGAWSDSTNRRFRVAFSKVGLSAFFIGQYFATASWHMMFVDVLGWGILSAGGMAVQAASLDDMFADRPELNSAISAKNATFAGISGCLGPLLGILCFNRKWEKLAFWGPACMLYAQALLFIQMPETLKKEKRKPFSVSGANPLSNCAMLFGSNTGLRRLALASLCYHSCTSVWATLEAYRTAALGWSPAQCSAFDVGFFLSTAVSTALVVPTMIARWGNRKLFQLWSNVAGLAYICAGQAWRPVGCSMQRRSVQYIGAATVLQDPWTDPCVFALRAMVIKQGTAVTNCGQGQLSAAYDGLTDLVGVVMPATWGYLFSMFAKASPNSLAGLIGMGGHFMLAGLLRIAAGLWVRSIADKDLFIDEKLNL